MEEGATGREGAQKSWTGRSPPPDPGRPVPRSEKGHVASLRSRAVGPFDDKLTDDGDVCPQVSGPVHADPLSRVRDDPRRATRSTRPPDGTLFTLSPQCRPLALTSSSFGAPNRMASSLGLRAAAPARARVATQSSRSMVVRAAVSTPAPVVVKREGTPGAGPAIHPKGKKERPPYPFAPTPPHPYARQPLTRSRPARPRRRHHVRSVQQRHGPHLREDRHQPSQAPRSPSRHHQVRHRVLL